MKKRMTAERRNEIARLLLRDGNLKASELSELFAVSTETIRKDLIYLEQQGIAQKSYGGAIASNELLERPFASKNTEHMDKKSAIAGKALELIPPNGFILLDAGSTSYALAKLLTLRDDLTIFTNSIAHLNLLSDSPSQLFAIGGRVRGSSKGIVGSWAIQALKSLHIDVAFLGTDGFCSLDGPSTASYEELEFKRTILSCTSRTVVLADDSKFQSNCLFQICKWEDTYALVTNSTENDACRNVVRAIQEKTNVYFA